MPRPVSPERKAAYYVGMAMTLIGLVLFVSVFFSIAAPKPAPAFGTLGQDMDSFILRGFFGMLLIVVGQVVSRVGARGLAGSGVVLDPERARRDLEPYSRMAGGMLGDALDEAGVKPAGPAGQVVMLRCRACGKLNEEDSRFCQECGQKI